VTKIGSQNRNSFFHHIYPNSFIKML
jgi:hypothetical protein